MKILNLAVGFILTMMLTAFLSAHADAKPTQDSILKFSWEGLSLGIASAQMKRVLESDGYTQQRAVGRNLKKVYVYQRTTDKTKNKVQLTEKDGVVTRFSFHEVRVGGKKHLLSAEAASGTYSRIKSNLGIEDSACRPGIKGGGTCNGLFATDTHENAFNINVTPRILNIVVMANPLHEIVVEANQKIASGIKLAYSCLKTMDINSVKEIHECILTANREINKFPPQGSAVVHRALKLDYPTISCANVIKFFRTGLISTSSDDESISLSSLPSCETIAKVIDRAAGRPPYWANCTNPKDDGDSIKACIEGYTPSFVNSISYYLPSCEAMQRSYKVSVIAGQPNSKGFNVSAPDCERLMSLAKSWRPELPDIIKPCDGYDPDQTKEHVNACLAAERFYIQLRNCQEVRAKYRYLVGLANGSIPENFYPLPCDQTEPLLAKAAALREKRQKEAEEFARKMAAIKERKKKAKQDYIYKVQEKMAKKYSDTPENVASRTSSLEKQIKASGIIPKSCNGNICPPTNEEMRLAMMRSQSKEIGLRIINGHLMHGNLPTAATFLMMLSGQQGKGTIGVEAHYKDVQIIHNCTVANGGAYECYFKLPFTTKYDELTSMYMDGLTGGLPFNINDMVHNMISNSLAREEYSYRFQIDAGGLWRAYPTMQQEMKNIKKQLKSIQSQIH